MSKRFLFEVTEVIFNFAQLGVFWIINYMWFLLFGMNGWTHGRWNTFYSYYCRRYTYSFIAIGYNILFDFAVSIAVGIGYSLSILQSPKIAWAEIKFPGGSCFYNKYIMPKITLGSN